MNKEELLNSLKCYIELFEGTVKINLRSFIEDKGIEVTEELLQYLYNNIKDLNGVKKAGHTIKISNGIKTEIIKSIIVNK